METQEREQPGDEVKAGERGDDGRDPSASEIIGAQEAALNAELGIAGSALPSGARREVDDVRLGGTGTHHRASFSDPLPDVGLQQAAADDVDDATGHRTPGPGSPEWMRQSSDQGGFGASIDDEESGEA